MPPTPTIECTASAASGSISPKAQRQANAAKTIQAYFRPGCPNGSTV